MSRASCSREPEVVASMVFGRVTAEDDDLLLHVSRCQSCAEALRVAAAFGSEMEAACKEADLPAAGLAWWRAQTRTRHEAAHAVQRPIAVATGLALSCAAGATGAVWGFAAGWFQGWLAWLGGALRPGSLVFNPMPDRTAPALLCLWLALAAWAVLVPVALYFSFDRD